MLEAVADMPKRLPYLTEEDILTLTARRGEAKLTVSVRLTAEARRILDEECERLGGLKRGEALEMILREIRELRKPSRKRG